MGDEVWPDNIQGRRNCDRNRRQHQKCVRMVLNLDLDWISKVDRYRKLVIFTIILFLLQTSHDCFLSNVIYNNCSHNHQSVVFITQSHRKYHVVHTMQSHIHLSDALINHHIAAEQNQVNTWEFFVGARSINAQRWHVEFLNRPISNSPWQIEQAAASIFYLGRLMNRCKRDLFLSPCYPIFDSSSLPHLRSFCLKEKLFSTWA